MVSLLCLGSLCLDSILLAQCEEFYFKALGTLYHDDALWFHIEEIYIVDIAVHGRARFNLVD